MPITNYYWDVDTDNVVLEEDENGNAIAEYTQEPSLYGELIAQERDGQASFYNFDGQGSTRELTDQNQNVTDTYTYDAFGVDLAKTGTTTNPFGYKGALGYYTNGDTNDIYVRARPYKPTVQRWLSLDPTGFCDGLNRFNYVANNPVTLADPTGMIKTVVLRHSLADLACGRRPYILYKFVLEGKSRCPGFFVSKIDVSCTYSPCAENRPKQSFTFYEASPPTISSFGEFIIINDERIIISESPGEWYAADFVSGRCTPGHYGDIITKATTRYYCKDDIGDLSTKWTNRTFGTGLCGFRAGPYTSETADFWDNRRIRPLEKETGRFFAIEWECCGCSKFYCKAWAAPGPPHPLPR